MSEQICLYLTLPLYLAQWYAHECHTLLHADDDIISHDVYRNLEQVTIPRASQESRILQLFLQKPPVNFVDDSRENATLAIVIPQYRDKNPQQYNYLGKYGRQKLAETIRNRFCINLWEELHTFRNALSRQDNAIYAYMEAHGIECSEINWNALAKIYQRQRNAYYVEKNRKKNSAKR